MKPRTCLLIVVAALAAERPAPGAGRNPPAVWLRTFDPPAHLKTTFQKTGNTFLVTSPQLGVLHDNASPQLYDPATVCEVTTEVRGAERGFDISYDITNPTAAPVALPALVLPGFPLDAGVEMLDHAFGLEWAGTLPQAGGSITSPTLTYPGGLYSPVMVLRDADTAVGLSLKYPVLAFRHPIQIFTARWPGDPNWTAYFFLVGDIAPGATRRYVVSVRYAAPADWIHTLQPYREYFWSLYGHTPSYVQDLRPVYGASVASSSFFGPANPRGFHEPERADFNGWKGTVDELMADAVGTGYRRIMLWAPSGLYQVNFTNNYAPQFMSEWTAPMVQTAGEFKRLQAKGVQVSFWWGHSAMLADQWDDPALEFFDPGDPAQVQAMLAEFTPAVQRGADGIGLDGYEQIELWLALPWLEKMRSLKSDAYFVAEAACADVLHLRVPFWLNGFDLLTPHLIADYLVPGREIWINLIGPEINMTRAKEVISWGGTVCWAGPSITSGQLMPHIRAALHQSNVAAGPAARRQAAGKKAPPRGSRSRGRR